MKKKRNPLYTIAVHGDGASFYLEGLSPEGKYEWTKSIEEAWTFSLQEARKRLPLVHKAEDNHYAEIQKL